MTTYALEWNALISFAARGDLEAVQCLSEAQVSSRADIREMTLVRKRIPPDSRGLYGDAALHAAAMHGHVQVVEYLIDQGADLSLQNDLGHTPLFAAAMQGHVRCVEKLITAGADIRRLSVDGKNALMVAGNEECRFLLRSLASDEEDEEARRKAEARQARLNYIMLRWAKASMVDAYNTWKDYALIPENKIARLIRQLDNLGRDEKYESITGIYHHETAKNLEDATKGTQFVVYDGKKGLGAIDGSGHPILFGISSGAKEEKAESQKSGQNEKKMPAISAMRHFDVVYGATSGKCEMPDVILKKTYYQFESTKEQLEILENDLWGCRSISTARQWAAASCHLLELAVTLVTRYHYIMDDPRAGSPYTNLQLIQHSVLRFADRMVKPHRTMLHGLRPQCFRTISILNSQALVNSREFPPGFPGSPSDRRLFCCRFLHTWAWLTACNNPPGYTTIPDLQDHIQKVIEPLRLEGNVDLEYLLDASFVPKEEWSSGNLRLFIQQLDIALPPKYRNKEALGLYYAKALAKVDGEPATDVGLKTRGPSQTIPKRAGVDSAFHGSILFEES
mmetsp:Transcript_3755/g.5921  ORF Transcript_3755/g.5921 Transcript_3755/m.5921 type:complete len:565 (+) Transcript_3755:81-1775(+)|eukprot:CAMPEP_0184299520 /NCGR_PEP_ID=MMETSP1049-20130417/10121_1 /TAXON_ID=77928 /ORGANISM="Proteomonas sulcata, Strain CCMP704" /LENGTH=564 /DNA_ID=CAMNT_0026609985 /DNA_START=30 /DNA_END=1724 /DNA_ORIENTATION=-